MEPLILRQIVPPELLQLMQQRSRNIKSSGLTYYDNELFKRHVFYNDAYFKNLHESIFLSLVIKKTQQLLKPSYSFLSFYHLPESVCPIHMDREQCYLTLDVCLEQKQIWPLYVYPEFYPHNPIPSDAIEEIKTHSRKILMQPGDAVIYSGSKQPHWREQMGPDNFCDLVFFHFVPQEFSGDLN